MLVYVIITIVVLIAIYTVTQYNNFVKLNIKIKEAFSNMDIYLKKRWDLVPNLVEIVKGYAKHEKETFKEVIALRNGSYDNMSDEEKIDANTQLSSGINKIMVLAEGYPDLKSNENFKDLCQQLTKIEDDIANSRKYYNGVIRIYNTKVKIFPSNIFAIIFGFKTKSMFEINENERKNVKIEL